MKVIFFHLQRFSKGMTKILIFAGEKRALQRTILARLASKEALQLQILEYYITNCLKSVCDFDHFLKSLRNLPLTPHSLIKVLAFLHCYLQTGRPITEQTIISFMNYLTFQCKNFIQLNMCVEGLDYDQCANGKKEKVVYTDTSTREDEISFSRESLIFSMAKTYIRYLLKIISIYEDFSQLAKMKELESHFVWMMINLLRHVSSFTASFTKIGRYFIREYGGIVVSLIQILTKDVRKINESIKKYIFHQNHILSCTTSASSHHEVAQFMKMIDEINDLNEVLIQIYLGKYFYDCLQHFEQPAWINTNSPQFDTIFKIAGKRNKESKVKQKYILNGKARRVAVRKEQ